MFNPKKEKSVEYVNRSLRLTKELNDQILQLAHKSDMSFNMFVNECIKYAISEMEEDSTP